ncbi:hypothetical protein JP74_00670 [Devosia sp. 17-2-E-8]|nr:hypothetical protein JP74_00670 [Devosia sp. 17-2-E-8]
MFRVAFLRGFGRQILIKSLIFISLFSDRVPESLNFDSISGQFSRFFAGFESKFGLRLAMILRGVLACA